MARPLRIQWAGGWYHLTARGNERRAIFRDEKHRRRFLELVEDWVDRFGLRLHAYVLMDNHYHLLVETPQANLSQAMQWLQVSYTVWFNRRHRRAGHLFQGRYQAILVEAQTAAWELSRYVHLNPVRVRSLGLDKTAQHRARAGLGAPPPPQVRERLERLRRYRWSSYRAYAGLAEAPKWLTTETILQQGGGRSRAERHAAYRRYVEEAAREGWTETPWDRLQAGVVLGGAEFVGRIRRRLKGNAKEQAALRRLRERPGFERVVAAVERLKGENWEAFRDRYGDWGRDLALYLGRRRCGMKLRELAEAAGGLDYGSASGAVRRFEQRLQGDKKLAALAERATATLENS
jgi:putative transposase